ncbi:hypothetical protein I8J29_24545 [Paenibacillus sp. MWE-103]|uniref:Uncharacterized protein n=1 Tax=Paenibacillus artemisiicola TaxID=1172618 RepID=A0ABS3WGA3_9BACL|nr:hypothetical protein [Paenibacillus artemisiicola]MBO7747359.1 hypothetical protein [Paenibacillus artemisiicola]
MARKVKAEKIDALQAENAAGETVILFKATVPLNAAEHADLAEKIRQEQEHSGMKIILVPYSVEVSIAAAENEAAEAEPQDETPPEPNPEAGSGHADDGHE